MADEYIRKKDAIDEINTNADDLEQNGGIPYAQGARAMAIVVEHMPPADVVPVVHACWKDNNNGTVSCSRCSTWFQKERVPYLHFCGYCGAKMDGEE